MDLKNCVKISYKGLTRHIECDTKFKYDDLVKTVMDKFNIENSFKLAIDFYDEQGHKYNKNTFEYLLMLFPNPQKLFFIRLDSSKVINSNSAEDSHSIPLDHDRFPFGKSKLNNRQTNKNEPEVCEAAPVRRQNCFLGEFPGSTSTQEQTKSSQRNNDLSPYLSLEIVKRMHLLKQSPPKKKHLNNTNVVKRSLRI